MINTNNGIDLNYRMVILFSCDLNRFYFTEIYKNRTSIYKYVRETNTTLTIKKILISPLQIQRSPCETTSEGSQ